MHGMPLVEDWNRLGTILLPFLIRCGVAALCGAMIGIERERHGKPAGFRTNILICLGSAIYMAVGVLVGETTDGEADPTRIAAQVVTGIGFLGAGCILQAGNKVRGLTTAATIWVVASIGLVAGAGFPILALVSTMLVILTLSVLRGVEKRYFNVAQSDDADV